VTRRALAVLCALCAAPAARAEVSWDGDHEAPRQVTARDELIARGNELLGYARLATAQVTGYPQTYNPTAPTPGEAVLAARGALELYEQAIQLGDDAAVRQRALTAAEYIEAADGFEGIVRHTDALRRLLPMNPRDPYLHEGLTISLSKLGAADPARAQSLFERAVDEYEDYIDTIDEADAPQALNAGRVHSNMAELLMAVGRLEEAINHYNTSVEFSPNEPLNHLGLAVAYDRDGQWSNAYDAMSRAISLNSGLLGQDPTKSRLTQEGVFFVPQGEIHYYRALGLQVLGRGKEAIAYYERFIQETVDPRWHARAREHIAELTADAGK
jgi:tetratricopeptide (TPR) repeat protein